MCVIWREDDGNVTRSKGLDGSEVGLAVDHIIGWPRIYLSWVDARVHVAQNALHVVTYRWQLSAIRAAHANLAAHLAAPLEIEHYQRHHTRRFVTIGCSLCSVAGGELAGSQHEHIRRRRRRHHTPRICLY